MVNGLARIGTAGLVVALACACSGPSTGSSPTPPAPASPSGVSSSQPTTAPPTAGATPLATAVLAALVLQPSDLPQGWTSVAYKAAPGQTATDAAFRTCLGVRDNTADKFGDVNSRQFSLGSLGANSEAVSYRTVGDLQYDLAALAKAQYAPCTAAALRLGLTRVFLPTGWAIANIAVRVTRGAGTGPTDVVGTVTTTLTLSKSGATQTIYDNHFVMAAGLVEASVDMSNAGQPPSGQLQARLLSDVADRVARA